MTYVPLKNNKLYIPLRFFFCKHSKLSLPLVALQYHDVKIVIKLRNAKLLKNNVEDEPPKLKSFDLYANYIFLDKKEREEFAKNEHMYLIEQIQRNGPNPASDDKHKLYFTHPVKELIWYFKNKESSPMNFQQKNLDDFIINQDYLNFESTRWFNDGRLVLNNNEYEKRSDNYFRFIHPYQYHKRIPTKDIYVYSFSLKPEDYNPSGSCNFSKIDEAILELTPNTLPIAQHDMFIFAVNYNILKISNGMGGLAFSY